MYVNCDIVLNLNIKHDMKTYFCHISVEKLLIGPHVSKTNFCCLVKQLVNYVFISSYMIKGSYLS